MLIGHSMPAVTGVSLGAGSSWLTGDAGMALFDGKPARATRLQCDSGNPTINVTLASAIGGLRVLALLGLNLPEGVTVTALGTSTQTRRLTDGTVAAWLVALSGAASTSVSVVLNTTQKMVEIGELVVMPAVDVAHEPGWLTKLLDPTAVERSLASQVAVNRRQPYRQLSASLTPAALAPVRGGGLVGGMDWESLRTTMANGRRCVAVPRWHMPGGGVDAVELARTAIYGIGQIGDITNHPGDFYASTIVVTEVPPLT